jgi:hypothetical protein
MVVLPPLTWYNGMGENPDMELHQTEVMYWGDNSESTHARKPVKHVLTS